jgi:protease-4
MSKILLHALARGVWAIDPNYAETQLNFIESLLRGENLDLNFDSHVKNAKAPKVYAGGSLIEISNDTWYGEKELSMIPRGSTVVIPVSGPIMKDDSCYSPGSMTLAKWISRLDQDPNCETIVLNIDSPGGIFDGTQTLADAIKKASTKTVAFINDGTAASAAYWVASAADEIVSSHKTNSVGSIGVYVQLANWEKHYAEKHNLQIISIYSDLSSEKNLPYKEALKGNDKLIREEMLNPLAAAFVSAVKENRSGKLNLSAGDPFKGKVYMSEEALAIGLIDRIGSLDEILKGGSGNPSVTSEITIQQNPTMKKFSLLATMANLLAFFSFEPEAGKDKIEVEASEEQFNEILNKAELSLGLEKQVAELTTKLEASEKTAADQSTKIASLEGEVAKLKEYPSATSHLGKASQEEDPNAKPKALNAIDAEAQRIYNQA